MLLAAMLMHGKFPLLNPTVKNQQAYFRIVEFVGKHFPFSSAPPPLIFHISLALTLTK